jgi:murein DD-endopeptidase MepM/ murein hydrolase activator NlpD
MSDAGVRAMRRVHIVTFAPDGGSRTVSLRRSLLIGGAVFKILLIVWAAFSLYLLLFRDTLVGKLVADQAQMRVEYEQRLAAERIKLDEAALQEASARETFEGRLKELLSRQAQLETRTESVAQLLRGGSSDQVSAHARSAGSSPNGSSERQGANLAKAPAVDPLKAIADFAGQKPRPIDESSGVSSYAEDPPLAAPSPPTQTVGVPAAPAPTSRSGARLPGPRVELHEEAPSGNKFALAGPPSIETVARSLDSVERLQVETLEHANSRAAFAVDKMRGLLRNSGLDVGRFAHFARRGTSNTGGPFLALPKDASAKDGQDPNFESLLHGLKARLEEHDQLTRAIALLPLRSPLTAQLEITSPFGARKDPFGMGWALHPGVDLHAEEGTIVRATAAGKVVNAAYTGGYGNMVEIEHTEGVATRYGHLSAILVSEGQMVAAGTPIGRVGSTGRSTGPHLHYETRIDGEAVDPMRFLKSANILTAATAGGMD